MNQPKRRRRIRYERRIFLLALLAGLPGAAIGLVLLWMSDASSRAQWTLSLFVLLGWWVGVLVVQERVVRPLQTLSNLIAALREGDFSIRARGARADDALGLALLEVNTLGETLRQQRLGALEATTLLRAVMEEIDVVVLAFDADQRLVLINRAGERLLAQPATRLLGLTADDLGLDICLSGPTPRTFNASFRGASGRWEIRRSTFRQGGLPHHLLVLTDLSRALRQEERQAWQRLVRVLSHEINNSLAPIQSIAGSLIDLLRADPLPADWAEDLDQGLGVIRGRSAALGRFMSAYARLARLPAPRREPTDVGAWVRRVASLEPRLRVVVHPGPDLHIDADGDQLDQMLINLIRNAADAALETGGGVEVGWSANGSELHLWIDDEGPGVGDTTNLFVPFYTTKPAGSGIGLPLSRQIAEAHGGTLTLANRDGRGARAEVKMPI